MAEIDADSETEDGSPSRPPVAGNNNPTGKNQYPDCPKPGDPQVNEYLREYHRKGITSYAKLSKLLKADHDISMGAKTVQRRLEVLGLYASGKTTKDMSEVEKRQLVADQLAKDPSRRKGPAIMKEAIAFDTGIHLTRDWIHDEMKLQDPEGFEERAPTAKKIPRVQLVVLGPNHEWSGDGHDKLSAIGFPIWGIRDVWCGRWLGLWVVPNNRLKVAIAYLYLSLVYEMGGMPVQSTTDCGSETTRVFALANALREYFSPELNSQETPAHRFLRSVHNVTIERGWLQLRLQWGLNVKKFWEAGLNIYDPLDKDHQNLVQWLWPNLIQRKLDTLKERFNHHKVRYDKDKINPSGTSPELAYKLYWEHGAHITDGLQPVDRSVIGKLMEELGGPDILRFVTVGYEKMAQRVFDELELGTVTFENIWRVFEVMLPHMSNIECDV
ncbi:hypothetical protein V5O48_014215 [Marasmius crinis-equi]|uniref:Integrase core domain-containing protein n=1 Tax=Marasmius crinis-equi TaxID=585013 RepID=A0ABR3EXY3_9AGAR